MNYTELSKEISYVLRHAPCEYELEMDEDGWVEVEQLLESLRGNERWKNLQLTDLEKMIEKSEKKRHELIDGRIWAFYGHSFPMHIKKEKEIPPGELFHGTARRFLSRIEKNGLLPMRRQYVHLSVDIETAIQVGKRHDDEPIILCIDAIKAWNENTAFYRGNEKVWLADCIPTKYIVEKM